MVTSQPAWQDIAAQRKHNNESKIPQEWRLNEKQLERQNLVDLPRTCDLMTDRELVITELSAVEILSRIRERSFTAVETTLAFCKRAAIAHQAVR